MNIKILSAIFVATVIAVISFMILSQDDKGPKIIDPRNVISKTINMQGMTCEACEIAIDKVVNDTGMVKVKSSSSDQRVEVEFDKTQTDIKTIMQSINKKGFTPVSYEDENGLHDVNGTKKVQALHEMKCGAGKCGVAGKCGGSK